MNNQANAPHITLQNVPNFDVLEHLTEFVNLCCIGMSECTITLQQSSDYRTRVGWVYFQNPYDCNIAVSKIDGPCFTAIWGAVPT